MKRKTDRQGAPDDKARELHFSSPVFDGHQEILDEYVYKFILHEEEAISGKRHIFDEVYRPLQKAQGTKFAALSVGGDHVAQVMYSAAEKRFWDAHKKLDVLLSEEEAGCDSFILCRRAEDIDRVLSSDKIGLIAGINGGRPLEGKQNLQLLANLRTLYRAGLRSLQLTGNGRNRLADGIAQERSRGRLTDFGVQVVKEADRLGMVIDTAQLSDYGFYDLLKQTGSPVIDSHSCASAVCNHPRNISDKRIKAIAERGGVIGVSFLAALVGRKGSTDVKRTPDVEDLIDHIDHIVEIAGIDHVGLGPDYSAYTTPVNRDAVKGYGNRGPAFCDVNKLTPMQSEKYPGIVEGIDYGIRKSDYISGPETHESFPLITRALLDRGYGEEQIKKILGENFLKVYKQVLK